MAAGGGGPAEGSRGDLLDLPAGVLFEAVVVAAGGRAVAQAGPAACLVGDVVFEVAVAGGSPAGRGGAGGVPDLGQVPELDSRVMTGSLEPVVACVQGDRVQREEQVPLAGQAGGELPGAVSAGRPGLAGAGEGESRRRVAGGSAGRVTVAAGDRTPGRGGFVPLGLAGCGSSVRVGRSRGRWRVPARR